MTSTKESAAKLVAALPHERIKSRDEYQRLGTVIAQAKTMRKEWTEFMRPIKDATRRAYKVAQDQFKEVDDVLDRIVTHGTPFLLDYDQWSEKYRAEKEAEATELAQKDGFDPFVATIPKLTAPDGLSKRATWRADVVSLMELVKAVAEGRAPLAYLEPNMKVLNLQARALKTEMTGLIPGVKPVEEVSYALKGEVEDDALRVQ